jgi:hypothetical protein
MIAPLVSVVMPTFDRLEYVRAAIAPVAEERELQLRSVPWVLHAGSIVEQVLRVDAQIATPSVMAELAFVHELGGFDESMRFVEDYDALAPQRCRPSACIVPAE